MSSFKTSIHGVQVILSAAQNLLCWHERSFVALRMRGLDGLETTSSEVSLVGQCIRAIDLVIGLEFVV